DFVDAQTKALAGKAIAAHIGAGGNLSREMKGMLENSTFGKEVWADMIKASPEATQAAKVLTGGAELTPATIDALKKKKKEKAVMSLLLVALGAITMEAFNSSLPQAA
ncbi:MAG: hypothetical protein KBD46_00575, partial [Candidatus Levybacteria bacterium]|nr:hypothetical protein [Candidatus Levybacteria bacterium]